MQLRKTLTRIAAASVVVIAMTAQPAFAGVQGSASSPRTALDPSKVTALNLDEPLTEYKPEVRWWLAMGAHTDETIKESVQELAESGFGGIEFVMLDAPGVDGRTFSYGSDEWAHDVKLIISEATKYDLSASFTSGTNWATANIPGLDPNSQSASQELGSAQQHVAQGDTLRTVPTPAIRAGLTQQFTSAVAYKVAEEYRDNPDINNPLKLDQSSMIDLTDDAKDGELEFTANDGDYVVFTFWQRGTAQRSAPAVEPAYAINYFDPAGFEALKEFWESYLFADAELVDDIRQNGKVQMFMDSLEIAASNSLFWTDDMKKTFADLKGYDIAPYLPVFLGTPDLWSTGGPTTGVMDFAGDDGQNLRDKVLADLRDVQTQMYMQNLMVPLKKWLNEEYGIKLRAQISYGKNLEISMPSTVVDYPETETRNQRDQTDIYRVWAGAAHLENKVLSSETSAHNGMNYGFSLQEFLQHNYTQYAGGVSRVIWHGYSADWGPKESVRWPGYEAGMGDICCRWGKRNPSAKDYAEYNDHLGRVQTVLRAGVPQVDLAVLYSDYAYQLAFGSSTPRETMDDLKQQKHEGWHWKDLTLQDAGYTYDYFAPQMLDGGYAEYDEATGLVAPEGPAYQALLLNQDWIPYSSAERVLQMAQEGLKVVIVDGAWTRTRWNDGKDDALAELRKQLVSLDNVVSVQTEAEASDALQTLNVNPRVGFSAPDEQLLSVTRKDADASYLFLYNYYNVVNGWDEGFLNFDKAASWDDEVVTNDIEVAGIVKPYLLDTWTGEISEVATYRHQDGKTIVPAEIPDGDVRVYIFKPVDEAEPHVTASQTTETFLHDGTITARNTQSGEYEVELSNGEKETVGFSVPEARSLTGWDANIEAWTPGELSEPRSETTEFGNFAEEFTYLTKKTSFPLRMEDLTTWDKLDLVVDPKIVAVTSNSMDAEEPVTLSVPLPNRSASDRNLTVTLTDGDFWRLGASEVTIPAGVEDDLVIELFPDGKTGSSTVGVSIADGDTVLASGSFDIVSGGVHLSDLDWVSSTNGWGPVERDLSVNENAVDGRPMTIAGRVYSKGLGAHANSDVVVDVPDGCATFVSDYGIDDEVVNSTSVASVLFGLSDGDTQLWTSPLVTADSGAARVEQDIIGVEQLTLSVGDSGNGNSQDHGDWAGAHFLCDPPTGDGSVDAADGVDATSARVDSAADNSAALDSAALDMAADSSGRDISGIGTYETTFEWDSSLASGAYLDMGALVESATVFVNGTKTDDVNLIDPVVDIPNAVLVDGQNALKIVVTSNLANQMLSLGYNGGGNLAEGGYNLDHQYTHFSYGLPQALLTPYQDVILDGPTDPGTDPGPDPTDPPTTPPTDPGTDPPTGPGTDPGSPADPGASGPGDDGSEQGELGATGTDLAPGLLGAIALLLLGGAVIVTRTLRKRGTVQRRP